MIELDKPGCQILAQAIVKKAVQDWCIATRMLRKNPDNIVQQEVLKDCVRFFLSDYFLNITDMDGMAFLERLETRISVDDSVGRRKLILREG